MPSYDPTLFNVNPYYDDFNEDKKFLRMLFRPGYAVQSRELTQLQTILQNQIERFGNHVFKDGSRILGGEISTQTLAFIRVLPATSNAPIRTLSHDDVVGYDLIQRDGSGNISVRARVVDYLLKEYEEDPYGVAVVTYLTGGEFSPSTTIESTNPDIVINVQTAPGTNPSIPHTGTCKVVGTNEGIYYIDGFFVKTENQFEPAYTLSNGLRKFASPTGIMGFDVQSVIVTDSDDYTLKDPASGSYNYNAPGSHRYKINLSLKFVENSTNRDFIELVTYSSGNITKKVEDTQYSDLIRLFAQRTFDESGNYIVKPFDVSFRDGSGNTFFADIGSGKAYVFGYEYETKFKDIVDIPKARTIAQYNDYGVDNYYGAYIVGKYNPTDLFTQFNTIFTSVRIGDNTAAPIVYGATGPSTGSDLSTAVFSARLLRMQSDDGLYGTQGGTMSFRAYLSDISYINTTAPADPSYIMNLYLFDPRTNVSYKLLGDVTNQRTGNASANPSVLPIITGIDAQSLIYPLNGNKPSTVVKSVRNLSYVHEVSRSFVVDSANLNPSISLGLGSEFDWCSQGGFVPTGTDYLLQGDDGYYLVYASTVNNPNPTIPIGTVIKIVSPSTQLPSDQITARGRISGDGDTIVITSQLPFGSYYLVGKAKNNSIAISSATDPATKIRNKILVPSYTENIAGSMDTINTFKRVIKRNSAGSIQEMYFVLNYADVHSILSITNEDISDVTNEFLFDNGQRDSVYDLARIYVKPEYFSKYTGSEFILTVTYSYFQHSGYGPFLKESYGGISYDNIPVYISPTTEKSLNLANAVDYRYVAKIVGYAPSGATEGSATSTTASIIFNRPIISYVNGIVPTPLSVRHSHDAYLPRIDKIVVSRNISNDGDITTLQRVEGVPSDSPIVPEDLGDSMTLFVMSIPAYTYNAGDVKSDNIGNSRYTMKDIGNISKRVDDLEQFAVLNELELDVASRTINNALGQPGIKKAILVDTFDGHSIADVADRDHRCSIDLEKGELKPSFNANCYKFVYSGSGQGITLTSDNILCSDYTKFSTPIISQEKASVSIKVNPFNLPNWVGNIKITPSADNWFDRTERPIIKSNQNNVNDAWLVSNMNGSRGYGSQWNDWESLWTGISVELTDAESQKNADFFSKPRTKKNIKPVDDLFASTYGIQRFTSSLDKIKSKYLADFRKKNFYTEVSSNTIVNKSVVPLVRGNTITFNAYNLKPKVEVHVFFDNVNVNQYCKIGNQAGPFTTNELDGSLLNVTMELPEGMFEVGEKILRIVDDANNIIENATTIAETIYRCSGIKEDEYNGVYSIRSAEIRKKTPNSSKIVSNPLYPQKNINTSTYNQWIDPLVQTFEISDSSYPNGIYIDSVDLYIAAKDSNLPITVELCPTVNGVPNSSVIIPFSTVVKNPSGITANANFPQATNFKFSSPVYLAPGTYGLIVKSNTSNYSLFAANIGELDIITDERISSTFAGGALFKPQNSAEPQADTSTDLMFKLNRCAFAQLTASTIILEHVDQAADSVVNLVQPVVFAFTPPGVSVSTKVRLGSDSYDAVPNRNLYLPKTYVLTDSESFDLVITPNIVQTTVSTFMIDMDRTSAVVVENLINGSGDNTRELSSTSGVTDSTARYISKKVTLPVGSNANELKVIMDANIPQDTFVRVYARMFNSSQLNATVNDQPYVLMADGDINEFIVGGNTTYSLNPNDFREISFTHNLMSYESFDTFSVKICMYSTDKSKVPTIKNLRMIALK